MAFIFGLLSILVVQDNAEVLAQPLKSSQATPGREGFAKGNVLLQVAYAKAANTSGLTGHIKVNGSDTDPGLLFAELDSSVVSAARVSLRDPSHVMFYTAFNFLGAVVGVYLLTCLLQFMQELSLKHSQKSQGSGAPSRSCLLDNARGFASTTVVFVHLTHGIMDQLNARKVMPVGQAYAPTPDVDSWLFGCGIRSDADLLGSDLQSWFRTAARQFDMPIFCFVSGLCSQGPTNKKRIVSLIAYIVAPWVFFRFLLEPLVFDPLLLMSMRHLDALWNPRPVYDDWYMIALTVWKLITLSCSKLNPHKVFAGMMFLTFFTQYMDLSTPLVPFAFTRTFRFLPYFGLGYIWPRQTILQVPSLWSLDHADKLKACGFLVLASCFMCPFFMDVFDTDFSDAFIFPNHFEGMPFDYSFAWVQTIPRVTKNMLIMLPVLTFIIPKEETFYTWIGRFTLYPYFLHRIFLSYRTHFLLRGLPPVLTSHVSHILVYIAHYGFCVAVCVFLTSAPVRSAFGWALEPKWLERGLEALLPEEKSKA